MLQFSSPAITSLRIQSTLNLSNIYKQLPSDIEAGGILCGKIINNIANVYNISIIPSIYPKQNSYHFDPNIYKYQQAYCGQNQIVGSFHTHPVQLPFPSVQDRLVSKQTKLLGCVLTDHLSCYQGERTIPVL